jgi:hypothetical protein
MTACCPCDERIHPPAPSIPAGLSDLPRQVVGFAEYRNALLAAIREHTALAGWRPGGSGDLGGMLLEMWAYVLDVTAFYDALIANASYLPTVDEQAAARRLAALIGYQSRPALAARGVLALRASGTEPVLLPVGTAFRSDAFGDEPPQIFATLESFTIVPQHNSWTVAPIRPASFDGSLLLRPGDGPPSRGQVVVLLVAGAPSHAARVADIQPWRGADATTYLRVRLDPEPTKLLGKPLDDLSLRLMGLSAPLSRFKAQVSNGSEPGSAFNLDGLFPQIQAGMVVVVERDGSLDVAVVDQASQEDVTYDVGGDPAASVTVPRTRVTLDRNGEVPNKPSRAFFLLHFNPIPLGRPTTPALTDLTIEELRPNAPLLAPVDLGDGGSPTRVVALGGREQGALLEGCVSADGAGGGLFTPAQGATPFPTTLRAPLQLHGNVIDVVRGESVFQETLGSAVAALPFQSFTLKKGPLTWIEDSGAPNGRRPLLEVRVDGLLWRRVETFYTAGPDDRVYVLRTDADGQARIVFGDGNRGARPASGVNNIRADYRFGAGGAKPPPGAVRQPSRPVKGLARALSPIPFEGGADAATPDAIRASAPRSALTLGRVVSPHDFEAVARDFAGVLNVAAGWTWDGGRQRALVKLWIVVDQGDPSDELASTLLAQAAPGTGVVVALATPMPRSFTADLDLDPAYPQGETLRAAEAALFDASSGLLSPQTMPIGGPIFRSVIVARLHDVPGVRAVRALRFDGAPMGWAVRPGEGAYFHWIPILVE